MHREVKKGGFMSAYREIYIKNSKGFSLIEVLIAIAVFAIGSLGIVAMFYSTSGGIRLSNDMTEAVFIAEDYLARTMQGSYLGMRPRNFTEGKYTVAVNITPNPPVAGNVANIRVTVTWPRVLGMINDRYTLEYVRAETRTSGI